MKAYTHIVADRSAGHSSVTRNSAGVSLPRMPWDAPPKPAPQAERKVTTLPAAFRTNAQALDAPEPIKKPFKFYAAKMIGETDEEWVARDWRERVKAEGNKKQAMPENTSKHAEAGRIGGANRRESEDYRARRDFIVSLVAKEGSTLGDIAQKYGRSKGSLSSMLPELVEAGRLIRFKRKNVYIYRVASHD